MKNIQLWNWLAVLYISTAICLLTLIPFHFKWLAAAQQLKWHFDWLDVIQNLFLFFPLGVVLAHTLKHSLFVTLLYGALLSSGIELAQLSDIGRTSNYYDIVSNTLGTYMGYFYYCHFVSLNDNKTTDIPFVFMLMPFCWFIAMRSATQEFMVWLIIPYAIVALTLFKQCLIDNRLKWLALLTWLVFAFIPLLYISRKATILTLFHFKLTSGFIILVIVPLLVGNLSFLSNAKRHFYIGLISLTTLGLILINMRWYLSKELPITWSVPAHLHWIDTLMSLILLVWAWTSSKKLA